MYDVVVKRSRSLSHLLMSSCINRRGLKNFAVLYGGSLYIALYKFILLGKMATADR